jgi:hypothetical protein
MNGTKVSQINFSMKIKGSKTKYVTKVSNFATTLVGWLVYNAVL